MGCHDESCSIHGHKNECHEGPCCSCCPCKCHHQEEDDSCCDHAHKLLELADDAWMEVLKEKIKDYIRSSDTKINEIARIVAETNHEHWHNKMAESNAMEQYEEKLCNLFKQGGSSTQKKGK